MFIHLPQWIVVHRRSLFLLPSLFFLSVQSASGQSAAAGDQWQLAATVKGVSVYYAPTECGGMKKILLKMHNANLYNVDIAWTPSFAGVPDHNVNDAMREKKIALPPGTTLAGSCESNSSAQLQIDLLKAVPTHAVDPRSFALKQVSVVRTPAR